MHTLEFNRFKLSTNIKDIQLVKEGRDPNIRGSEIYNINLSGAAIPPCAVENFVAAYKMECNPYTTHVEFEEAFVEKFLGCNPQRPKAKALFLQPVVLRNVPEVCGKINPSFIAGLEGEKIETYASFDIAARIGDEGLVFGDAKAYSSEGKHGEELKHYHFVGTPYDEGILISKNPLLNVATNKLLEEMFEKHRVRLQLKDVESEEVSKMLQMKSFPATGPIVGSDRGSANSMINALTVSTPLSKGSFKAGMIRGSTLEGVAQKRKRST